MAEGVDTGGALRFVADLVLVIICEATSLADGGAFDLEMEDGVLLPLATLTLLLTLADVSTPCINARGVVSSMFPDHLGSLAGNSSFGSTKITCLSRSKLALK